MITDQISIMETIPTQAFGNVKLEIKGTLEPGETELEAWRKAKVKINEAYQTIYGLTTHSHLEQVLESYAPSTPPTIQVDRPTVSMEDQIKSCDSVKVLETYKLIVRTAPHLQKIYDEKLAELSI